MMPGGGCHVNFRLGSPACYSCHPMPPGPVPPKPMLSSLPAFLRIPLVSLLIVLSTIAHTTPLLLIALIKWLVPLRGFRIACAWVLVRLAESWIAVNSGLIALFTRTRFSIEGEREAERRGALNNMTPRLGPLQPLPREAPPESYGND